MGASGYEIRQGLLGEAKDILLQRWHHRVEVERQAADFEKRKVREIAMPDAEEIIALAETLYGFVQRKD